MTDFRPPSARSAAYSRTPEGVSSRRRLAFSNDKAFQLALHRRVDDYFRDGRHDRRDLRQWYIKAASILSLFTASYLLLVFVATAWWQAVPLAIVLALATTGIGFNIMHDGGHGAVSNHRAMNRLMAHTLDIVGGSSYLWRWKHGVLHHSYSNITGHDMDVSLGMLARFTPYQARHPHQRWQQWYIWFLYGVMAIKWQFFDDFRTLALGRIGPHRIPRPRGADLVWLVLGKVTFFVLAFVVPLALHPLWAVAGLYVLYAVVLGVSLSVVFQLAHCVEEADFPELAEGTRAVDNAWAVHQVETTVDFSRGNRVMTWLLGGLNYQIEHHLFPDVSHCNYPGLSPLVRQTCAEFGIVYKEHPTIWSGLRSHFRWLRRMGAPLPLVRAYERQVTDHGL
jgi:linoleoyl-CoA desaturase